MHDRRVEPPAAERVNLGRHRVEIRDNKVEVHPVPGGLRRQDALRANREAVAGPGNLRVRENSTNWPSPTVDFTSTPGKAQQKGVIWSGSTVLIARNRIEAGICQARPQY